MNTKVMFSSKNEIWATPQDFYDKLNAEFQFTLDPCANAENHKCAKYFTATEDGLKQSWKGNRVFCNPPYGRNTTGLWVKKAYDETCDPNTTAVLLLPARTDTRWFHDFILGKAEVRFVRGRLKFGDGNTRAPFPSMIVIFRPHKQAERKG